MPKLGALKDLFPSMCDAFQLPDLLLDSLFNPNVSYMDNHALHCSEPGLCLSFQSRRSPLQEAPHWCPRCKMWETSCPVTPPPKSCPPPPQPSQGPRGWWLALPPQLLPTGSEIVVFLQQMLHTLLDFILLPPGQRAQWSR